MILFPKFLKYQNFELAFTRVLRSGNKQYKRFYRHLFSSYNLALRHNLSDTIEEIRRGTFHPDGATIIYQPKKSGVLRPLTLLSLRDLIIYQAAANVLAEAFARIQERHALKRSFGALYAGKGSPFFYRSWKVCYSEYNDAITRAFMGGKRCVADFDLVSFYELIDHSLLRDILSKQVGDAEFLGFLFKCLGAWTGSSSSPQIRHGLPQGPEPSAFLAECVLFRFDAIVFRNLRYLRYVDDIKLMSEDEVPIRRALVKLDLASKTLGLVPQAQKIEFRRARNLKEVLKTIPSSLALGGPRNSKRGASQKSLMAAFKRSLEKAGRSWEISDVTKFKYSLNRLKARRDVLRRIAPFLSRRPDLSWFLARYVMRFPKDKRAAGILLDALKRDPTYDSAAANYIDAMDICEPQAMNTKYRRVIRTARQRSEEKSIVLSVAALSFRGRRKSARKAVQLVESQPDTRAQGLLIHSLFGEHPGAPFKAQQCQGLLGNLTESSDPDLSRYAASLLLGAGWPWFVKNRWKPTRSANRSVQLLVTGLGLRKRAPKRVGVLETYFRQVPKIAIGINWKKALAKDLRPVERKCLRLQQLATGDPSARVMMLDVFNESLIQAFSARHALLKGSYRACIKPKQAVPDYGNWLRYKNALLNVLPNATLWLTEVHDSRRRIDLAHSKDRKTGTHTRPISFRDADKLFKKAQNAWAELIREWVKIL